MNVLHSNLRYENFRNEWPGSDEVKIQMLKRRLVLGVDLRVYHLPSRDRPGSLFSSPNYERPLPGLLRKTRAFLAPRAAYGKAGWKLIRFTLSETHLYWQ